MLVFSFLMTLVACGGESLFNESDSRAEADGSYAERGIDRDGDSYGDAAAGGTDCDDTDATVNPGALELCDTVDNDCDDMVDGADNNNVGIWFGPDFDYDTYVDSVAIVAACDMSDFDEMVEKLGVDPDELDKWIEVPIVQYGTDGSLAYPDCDDEDATVNPWATESCDGKDNDCNELVDDGVGTPTTWYADSDGDTYGDMTMTTTSCSVPSGYVGNDDDCNDGDSAISPAATEMCDGVDNDCDGSTDGTDAADVTTFYLDLDSDGYGDGLTYDACSAPAGYVATSGDCDDTDASANPGAAEVCDSVDNDCNGSVDDGTGAPTTWYEDMDGDLYGDSAYSATTCDAPVGYVETSGDCNDTMSDVNPLATEVSNGYDDDCDTLIDEGVTCTSEVDVIYGQGDAITITANATDSAFDGNWWNGTTSGVSGVAATEASLGGDFRQYTFTFDMCFVSGTTEVDMTGTFDLGGDLCEVSSAGAILRAYEDGTRLTVTKTSDGMGGCYYAITK